MNSPCLDLFLQNISKNKNTVYPYPYQLSLHQIKLPKDKQRNLPSDSMVKIRPVIFITTPSKMPSSEP